VIWYQALRGLNATTAATVQLCVPVLATLGGALLLSEPLSWRLLYSAVAILGGLALVTFGKARPRQG
jgi:drug/metabolite transporter (DMT)-like permease